jgi:hypothetical protein
MPVLRALARWGVGALDEAGPETRVRPVAVVNGAFIPYYDRAAARDVQERYLLVLDGEEFWLSSIAGHRPSGSEEPDLTLEGPAWALMAARQRTRTLDDLIADGTLRRTKGTVKTQRNFERVFSLR